MVEAFKNKDIASFKRASDLFMNTGEKMEEILSTSPYYMLGRWVEQAKALAENADDFSKQLYEFNAKAIVTTWGAYNQAEIGQLHDYSNRQWAGLIKDFYMPRWERWITARVNELEGKPFEEKINWFKSEWEWARGNECYPTEPSSADLKKAGNEILNND